MNFLKISGTKALQALTTTWSKPYSTAGEDPYRISTHCLTLIDFSARKKSGRCNWEKRQTSGGNTEKGPPCRD